MSIFSLNWFKSKRKQELEELQVEEQRIKNELLRKQLEPSTTVTVSNGATYQRGADFDIDRTQKPYSTVKLVNKVLTVILNDGSILSKPDASAEDFQRVKSCTTELEIVNICSSDEVMEEKRKQQEEYAKARAIKEGIAVLGKLSEFELKDNSLYFRGINRSIPELLVEELLSVVGYYVTEGYDDEEIVEYLNNDEEYMSLKRFFMWCCLNPRAEVANDLFGFLKKNSFRITKQGFFVALRNVVTVAHDNELVHFISNAYNKVKAVWKKNPENFFIIEDESGEYTLRNTNDTDLTVVGNLKELYLDLPNMSQNRFTDDYTKTFDIRVGKVVNMPPEECSWSTADCAHAGLHFTADQIHYVGCGDTSVLILINPMKVVGIGDAKGRCYEYLPIMTVPREEATSILHDLDFDTLELDEDYAVRELENLEIKAKEGFVAESTKYEFNLPHISTSEIRSIVASLEEMKYEISKRIVNLN